MPKYLIDIPDGTVYAYDEDKKILIFQEKDFIEASEVSNLVYLPNAVPYEEPDRKAIEDEVWELAKKLITMSGNEVSDMIGCATNFGEVMYNMPYKEVKAKYEAWKKKDEIRVGDEIDIDGEITVVTMVNKHGEILSVDCGGMTYYYYVESQLKRAKKTGRHFDEVEDLLKKIGEK